MTRRPARLWPRLLVLLVLLALAAAAVAVSWFYATARRALPQLDGAVRVAGLHAPVTVVRDAQGVPHITASTADDLFFAQGYVTAQDRLWQMDMSRRYASGELAEILGPSLIQHDRQQRILGLRQAAERGLSLLSPAERAHYEAYARGVNAYIESRGDRLPVEFHVLRYSARHWTPLDSLLCGANLWQTLSGNLYLTAVERETIARKLGPELAADLYVNSSWRDHPPGADSKPMGLPDELNPEDRQNRLQPDHGYRNDYAQGAPLKPSSGAGGPIKPSFGLRADLGVLTTNIEPSPESLVPGSNNWAVSGQRTASGRAMLANDMHLVNTVPNTWYEAHLKITGNDTEALDVAGVTLPGLPYVVMGHNQRIAWGYTNMGPAVQDVFVETLRAGQPAPQYQTPTGWQQAGQRSEVIYVKGEPPVVMRVISTRHGPIISELIPGESRPLALKWTLYDPGMMAPLWDLNRASNWQEFRSAVARFAGPAQNMVYADAEGHIGYQAMGRIPIRASGDGSVPVSGADDAHEWTSFVPFEKLPSVFDPSSGIVATANGRITPDGYAYVLSTQWAAPYRTERIYRVLRSSPKLNAEQMLRLQTDIYSVFDRYCADRFAYAVDHVAAASPRAKEAARLMRGWDGRVTADSVAPTLVTQSRNELWRLLLEPRLGPSPDPQPNSPPAPPVGWRQYSWFMSEVALENILERQPQRWLPPGFRSYDDLLAAAVEAAASQKSAPRDLSKWTWGSARHVEYRHPVLGAAPLVGRWAGTGSRPLSGNGNTVKQMGRQLGPSERMVTDFADLDATRLNIVSGQSGQILSPHFRDQFDAWYEGRSFVLAFSDEAVAKAKQHELRLEPR
ncbi:MAG TPA: penicillin acylase family protein [Terriglobales bacterium]|nr:penicillin acylase family protein [Terriglobales bacterium]